MIFLFTLVIGPSVDLKTLKSLERELFVKTFTWFFETTTTTLEETKD
jgi:hypothetical protein